MSLPVLIYLIDVAGQFKIAALFIGILCVFPGGMILAAISESWYDGKLPLKHLKIFAATILVSLSLAVLLPSQETSYKMLFVSYGQELVENPAFKQVGDKVLKVINKKLDELGGEK